MNKFEKIQFSDLTNILKIENQCFDNPWTYEQIGYEIKENKFSFNLGIYIDKDLFGYSLCHYIQGELHINNFAIDPNYQNKGFGKALLEKTIEYSDCETAYLEVNVNNKKAINLYEKFGFKSFTTRKNYYQDGTDALVMIYG